MTLPLSCHPLCLALVPDTAFPDRRGMLTFGLQELSPPTHPCQPQARLH